MSNANQKAGQPIVRAELKDLNALLEIMKQANQYALSKSGKLMWTTQHAEDGLRTQLKCGDCFVIRNPDKKIAAAIVLDEEDIYAWDDQGKDGKALYVHKLMKNPQYSQANVGLKLMHFAAQEALRRGKRVIRCDTIAGTTGLIDYYLKLGFITQRTMIYKSSNREGVLMQAESQLVFDKTAPLE